MGKVTFVECWESGENLVVKYKLEREGRPAIVRQIVTPLSTSQEDFLLAVNADAQGHLAKSLGDTVREWVATGASVTVEAA